VYPKIPEAKTVGFLSSKPATLTVNGLLFKLLLLLF
jgi:hypothetical protein